MYNRYKYYSLDTLVQMQLRASDYVMRKLVREPEWLGSKSFHARMRTIRLMQKEINSRETNI